MKNTTYLLFVFTIALSSCDFLDVVPDNVATVEHAFSDRERAEQYLFTTYSYLHHTWDNANPDFRSDAWWSNPNPDVPYPGGFDIKINGNNTTDPILDFWSGGPGVPNNKLPWDGIRDCNIFLDNIDDVNGMDSFEKARWAAEVKFLKAYYHFWLLRMYGPIPIMDDDLPVSITPDEAEIYREPVDEVVDYIVDLIDEASSELPMEITDQSELGRITRPIALAVKAKVLVTAASPLFNGNQSYRGFVDDRGIALFNPDFEPEKWERAAEVAKAAIDTAHQTGHRLYTVDDLPLTESVSDSTELVLLSQQIVADRWNREIIWGAPTVGDNARLRALWTIAPLAAPHRTRISAIRTATLKMAEMFYSDNGVPIDEDVNFDYEDRYSLVEVSEDHQYYLQPGEETAKLHVNREPRFYGSLGVDSGWWYGFGREDDTQQWPINAQLGEPAGRHDVRKHSPTAIWTKKHHSFRDSWSGDNLIPYQWGPPVLRLADLYLLYAEALNESLDAPNQEVYEYVDMVRERAGHEGVEDSWSNYSDQPQKYQSREGMREIIQRERSIELAFEMHRLWDITRWGRALEEFDRQVEGWNAEGETAEEFYQVRVLNQQAPPFTSKDIFWPIEQSELSRNPNLIQNPGW